MTPALDARTILPCPGLETAADGRATFVDSLGERHDLTTQPTLRPKEAASDPRLCGLSAWVVRRMIADGELYPVLRLNSRVLVIFDCGLSDWRARALARRPHLFATRSAHVA